jgi:hypothetical protein
MKSKLVSNSQSSHLSLPSVEITGMYHHAQLHAVVNINPEMPFVLLTFV